MRTKQIKVARIGNSRGVRLPAESLKRYAVGAALIMEERAEGILLRPAGPAAAKLGWTDTAREMAGSGEDWVEWSVLDADGLSSVPWEGGRGGKVGEKRSAYSPARVRKPADIKRYDLRWAVLGPGQGAEMVKTRPVVVVSRDELNAQIQTVTVCPVTSRLHPAWRSRLPVRIAGRPGEIAVDQIRTVAKTRLGRKIGALAGEDTASLRRLITEMYGE